MKILKKVGLAAALLCAGVLAVGCSGGEKSSTIKEGNYNICYYAEADEFYSGEKDIWIETDRNRTPVRIVPNGDGTGTCTVYLGTYATFSGVVATVVTRDAEDGGRYTTVTLDFSNSIPTFGVEWSENEFTRMIAIKHPHWVSYDPDEAGGEDGVTYVHRSPGLIARLFLSESTQRVSVMEADDSDVGDTGFPIAPNIINGFREVGVNDTSIKALDWIHFNFYGDFYVRDLTGGVPSTVGKK